ncbi:hypothetical protein F5Y15DRAFT_411412 [Xylariaceae sp. FL0016]|nr:hypothetical protein F5Y15DRAFT_411412 [Xylariaceae sp. FL0016]
MNSMHTAPAAQITSNVSISYDNAQPGQQPGSSGTPHRPHVSYPTPTDRRSNLPGEGEGLPPPVTSTSRSGSLPSTPQRRGGQTRLSRSGSDWNGDEEGAPQEDPAYHFFDSFPDSLREDPLRPQQFLRGAVSSRRVASKTAVASLQSVPLSELPDGEKICIICYNDFGVENPEGINEAPLRLPKCKHVFGDHCIKKWFEDSDSCPYCRDKVHSEPVLRPSSSNTQSIFNYLRRQQAQFQIHALRQQNRERVRTESGTVPTEPTQDDFFRGSGMPPGSLGDFAAYAHHRRSDGPNLPAGARHNTAWTAASGRRSPPNETGDSRRRTRPRHNTMRGSPPSIRSNGRSSTWASAPAINDLPSFPPNTDRPTFAISSPDE